MLINFIILLFGLSICQCTTYLVLLRVQKRVLVQLELEL